MGLFLNIIFFSGHFFLWHENRTEVSAIFIGILSGHLSGRAGPSNGAASSLFSVAAAVNWCCAWQKTCSLQNASAVHFVTPKIVNTFTIFGYTYLEC